MERYNLERHKKTKERKLFLFVFDKFANYKSSWSKLLGRVTKSIAGVPIAYKKYGLEHNNNPIERYNGSIKDRLNGMRGQFKSFEGAEAFMNLKDIIYNFVNPHQQIEGITPAEKANIKMKLGRNKLLNLIRKMGKSRHHSLR